MFIPYKDDNVQILVPHVTRTLLALNVLIFMYQLTLSETQLGLFIYRFGAIPGVITGQAGMDGLGVIHPWLTLITSLFLHGSIPHLLGNMLFLYIFADNLESILGHRKFLFFYLAGGVAATLTHILIDSSSIVPLIGASGAISAVMAGYMLKYPTAQIHVFVAVFPMKLPAVAVVGFWFIIQVVNGLTTWNQAGGGVAWFAHIGGFIAGSVLMLVISKGNFYWLKR